MQGDDAEEPSLLQLVGGARLYVSCCSCARNVICVVFSFAVSSAQELPEFCLLSSLFGESHTCCHDLPDAHTNSVADPGSDHQDASSVYV